MFETRVGVVGVTFKNRDGSSRQLLLEDLYDNHYTEGETEFKIELRREPDNEYDENAVAVFCLGPVQGQIGYLPGARAEWISPAIETGRFVSVALYGMGMSRNGKVGMSLMLKIRDGDESPDESPDDAQDSNVVEDKDGRRYELS